jgi:putative FmdB family regulatory protein
MPLYEYRCLKCGHQFEKIQSFSAPEEKECPVCQGPVERLISAPAVQFKGTGWYVTDYAGKGGSKKSGDAAKAGDGGKSGDGGGDKPAASGSDSSGTSSSTPASSTAKGD